VQAGRCCGREVPSRCLRGGGGGGGGGGHATPFDGGRVVRRFPTRLYKAQRDAVHGPVSGGVGRTAVHAEYVPHEDVRQPLHHGHRHVLRQARRARQLHVRQALRHDALHVRAVPLRRFSGAHLGKVSPPTLYLHNYNKTDIRSFDDVSSKLDASKIGPRDQSHVVKL